MEMKKNSLAKIKRHKNVEGKFKYGACESYWIFSLNYDCEYIFSFSHTFPHFFKEILF